VVTFTADGPAAAHPGDMVTYGLQYAVEGGPGTDVVVSWFGPVTYVSTAAVSGEIHRCEVISAGDISGHVRCGLAGPTGVLETALQVRADATGGVVRFWASEPGSGSPDLPPLAGSNTVVTLIAAAAPPGAGNGPLASSERVIPLWLSALLVAAGMAALAAAAQVVLADAAQGHSPWPSSRS